MTFFLVMFWALFPMLILLAAVLFGEPSPPPLGIFRRGTGRADNRNRRVVPKVQRQQGFTLVEVWYLLFCVAVLAGCGYIIIHFLVKYW